jgi:putative phage-type endonuclease
MTAVLGPAASEAEWLAARRQGVTASEIAVIMGLSPYSSPFALYHQKTGDLPPPGDNMAMALGRHLEDFVCGQFDDLHPEWVVTGCGRDLYAHPDRAWQMATPDREVWEYEVERETNGTELTVTPAVLEAKTSASYDGWGDDGTDEIPVHYRCQVLWQMDVLGVQTGYVACLFLHSRQLRVYELTMGPSEREDLRIMRREAMRFLHLIEAGPPPEVDWRPATSAALRHLHPDVEDRDVGISAQLAWRYRAACRNVRHWEQRKSLYENQIRERVGTGHRAVSDRDGGPVARRDVYDVPAKTISRKAFTVNKLVPIPPWELSP